MSRASDPDTASEQSTDDTQGEAETDDEKPELTEELVSEELRIDGICGVY